MRLADDSAISGEGWLLRVATFRTSADRPSIAAQLRAAIEPPVTSAVWIGRRLMDHPDGPEFVTVSVWSDEQAMKRGLATLESRLSEETIAAVAQETVEIYSCRAYGAWSREAGPHLLRILRGRLVEGDPAAFDLAAAGRYLANFESNTRCASIVAALRPPRDVILATLWTNWDAVVSATGGDLRQVLPVKLPGWEVAGEADHYEILATAIPAVPRP